MKTITAADANRQFSRLLRDVAQGEVYTVVSRGKPAAIIGPAGAPDTQRRAAKGALLTRLRSRKPTGERNWTRDELYE